MLNINFTKKKFNKLLLSINKLIESFFNNISNLIKEYKKKNSRLKKINNLVFLCFGLLVISFSSYFLIPTFYDKNSVKLKLENQIINKYNLKVNFTDKISYALFPRPHFYANNLSIFQDENLLISSKNTKIYISAKNFFKFDELKVKDILFKNNEFNLKKNNLTFFTNILNSNISDHNIIFKDSIIFYKDISDDVIFLVDLNRLNFFYDLEDKHQLNANYKIFNLPFNFYLSNNPEKKFLLFNLKSKDMRFEIKNFLQYKNKDFEGLFNIQVINNINSFKYNKNKNSFLIKSEDDNFKGDIDIKPFYFSFDFNLNELDIKKLIKENSIFMNLINSEIYSNQNINADININLEKIKSINYLEKIHLKTIFEEGNVYINNSSATWNDSVLIKIVDTQLLNEDNNIKLIGSIVFDFINLGKFYNYYQIKNEYRYEIKKIKFEFIINLNERKIKFINTKINNHSNNKINNFINNFNSQNNNFFNKVIFRNFVKNFFEYF